MVRKRVIAFIFIIIDLFIFLRYFLNKYQIIILVAIIKLHEFHYAWKIPGTFTIIYLQWLCRASFVGIMRHTFDFHIHCIWGQAIALVLLTRSVWQKQKTNSQVNTRILYLLAYKIQIRNHAVNKDFYKIQIHV